ncbi:hypothetical protein, partial [Geitlerinema sp. P-1104]|uniref:hypothetical protein n=1 Tax=Geitlerinema sp. P-1104 TaxID=2546230 RepID=UPI0014770F9E
LSLIVGAILLRTISRTEQVMLSRRDRIIYNAATPAIDRAKAKLEFMFDRDREPRLPSGIPAQDLLRTIMLNPGVPTADDPYTLPGETRIDINGDGNIDNAWAYQEDSNGDGETDLTVAYSIIWEFPDGNPNLQTRARNLLVRQGPVSGEPRPGCGDGTVPIENGWLRDAVSTALLRKNFQINAFVISEGEDRAVTTLEVQQEREASRLNKWGAWFRNDLEVFPGADFRWNGAMHTDGNFMVGNRSSAEFFQAYLVSGPGSCIYQAGASTSEITVSENDQFTGQIIAGLMNENTPSPGGTFHVWSEAVPTNENFVELNQDNDSIGNTTPADASLDPIRLFTEDVSRPRGNVNRSNDWKNFPSEDEVEEPRILNQRTDPPFIDDVYRADDRYGPVPVYGGDRDLRLIRGTEVVAGESQEVGLGVRVGEPITGASPETEKLIRLSVQADENPKELGLDGYWERRAWREGMRVIVGQRLELGNDPFSSPTEVSRNSDVPQVVNDLDLTANREHESLQRRSFRDNLSAAQTTAIYHWSEGADGTNEAPVAALLTTVHPGTAETLKRAAIFEKPQIEFGVDPAYNALFGPVFGNDGDEDELLVDFFTGRGTNGWELDVSQLDIANNNVNNALQNLANFAGDPDGAFPPLQEPGAIHPSPAMTEWGNFSNLRRTLNDDLGSLADYSNKHTAALTLGALAYNVSYLDALDYGSISAELDALADRLLQLRDGNSANGEVLFFPTGNLGNFANTYTAYKGGTDLAEDFNGDGDAPTLIILDDNDAPVVRMTPSPEAYIEALAYTNTTADPYDTEDLQELARLIYLKEQVKRDRRFGFLPSDITQHQATVQFPISTASASINFSQPPADIISDIEALAADDICGQNQLLGDCFSVDPSSVSTGGSSAVLQPLSAFAGKALNHQPNYPIDASAELQLEMSFGCDWSQFGTSSGLQNFTLANSLCAISPKFPSLYYVLPSDDAEPIGNQPESETEVASFQLSNSHSSILNLTRLANNGSVQGYDLNQDGDIDDEIWYTSDGNFPEPSQPITFTAAQLIDVVIQPVGLETELTLPYVELNGLPSTVGCDNNASAGADPIINPNCQAHSLVYKDGTYFRVAFKDNAFYMGRDRMNTRALNVDLELLSNKVNNQLNGTTPSGDTWLAAGDDRDDALLDGGIVYAFREDGVREDAIERAPGGNCQNAGNIGNGCNTNVITGIDPNVNENNGISPKSVNFNPDPDRQIHGFRIINGEDISRPTAGVQPFGLSFISDNPAFVQGDFNCHKRSGDSCDNVIEEFNFTLSDRQDWGPNQFYNQRRNTNQLDNNFANPDGDSWRYSEFLVDGFAILSDQFCDGSIEDLLIVTPATSSIGLGNELKQALEDLGRDDSAGEVDNVYGCFRNTGRRVTSYSSFLRPNGSIPDNEVWLRENPADAGSPIRIASSGNPLAFLENVGDFEDGQYAGNYLSRASINNPQLRQTLVEAADQQRVNAMMISGITPSRAEQSYGGLHNFPRFNEEWRGRNVLISGSLMQLRFSNYATGPYDHDAWEPTGPNSDPVEAEVIGYYGPPTRLWGYDVALQLTRVGPVSSRQTRVERVRSEFYREPSADDLYIQNLRCAVHDGTTIDPRATDCP